MFNSYREPILKYVGKIYNSVEYKNVLIFNNLLLSIFLVSKKHKYVFKSSNEKYRWLDLKIFFYILERQKFHVNFIIKIFIVKFFEILYIFKTRN